MHTLESCQAGVGSNSTVCSREPLFSRELLLLSRFAHCCAQPGGRRCDLRRNYLQKCLTSI